MSCNQDLLNIMFNIPVSRPAPSAGEIYQMLEAAYNLGKEATCPNPITREQSNDMHYFFHREEALRGKTVPLSDIRLKELQSEAVMREGTQAWNLHWHFTAALNELIFHRSRLLP